MTASPQGPGVVEIAYGTLKAICPIALWVSGMRAPVVFKARCFGGSSLTCRSLKLRCLMWDTNLLLLRGAPDCESSPDYGWLWRGVGFMVRLHFSLPYLPPDLFLLCSFEEIIQLVFRSFSQNFSICSCRFLVSMRECEFKIFLCRHLEPPAILFLLPFFSCHLLA